MGHSLPTGKSTLKRLIGPFVSPPTYDFWSRQLGSTHAWSRCYARIIDRREEGDQSFTLRLRPNSNFAGFVSGQHVNVTATIRGRRITRSYSFSSTPQANRWIEITVRHDPQGTMSHWLFEHARCGTRLELDHVFGDMTSSRFSGHALVFLAAGSGITPLMSLLREQSALGFPHPLTLVYWERHESRRCFAKELQELADRNDRFSLHTIATEKKRGRRLSTKQLEALNVKIDDAQVLACGNGAFVEQARRCAEHRAASFDAEAFSPPPRETVADAEKTFSVELTTSKRSIEVSNRQTLLDALEEQGLAIETGCRMGVCNTCACVKIAGQTQATDTSLIDSNTQSSVRLCISQARSDLQLAL